MLDVVVDSAESTGRRRRAVVAEQKLGRARVTIGDIANRAGVSKGAVSYALNGRPGVSAATRERILEIAAELGWYPNSAARALSVSRANACGFVLARPAKTLALEPFFMEFIAGVESELSRRSVALTLQLAADVQAECEVYRRWWSERRVDGILLVDLRVDDPRVAEINRLGLPAVVVGRSLDPESALPEVWHEEHALIIEVVRYLTALGHTRIARVAGNADFVHVERRSRTFAAITADLGVEAETVTTNFSSEAGARATRQLLTGANPPTAIVYDSDLLAVSGMGVATQMGFDVPHDVSIVAWDDSLLSQIMHPPLTTITRDITEYGAAAITRLLEAIDGRDTGNVETPAGQLVVRGSTGPAPKSRPSRRRT
jgi:DNA-binding LacI/PurR family transcriptional regulator